MPGKKMMRGNKTAKPSAGRATAKTKTPEKKMARGGKVKMMRGGKVKG